MFLLLAATTNAVVVSFFVSFAAAGGFLAFFFACLTAIYVGVLAVAFFVISTVTVSAIIAIFIATGMILKGINVFCLFKQNPGKYIFLSAESTLFTGHIFLLRYLHQLELI